MKDTKNFEFSKLNSFLIGVGVGAIVALIFAPKSGEELREDISGTAHRGINFANSGMKEVKSKATRIYKASFDKTIEMLKASRNILDKQKEIVSNAVDAGKKAYLENKNNHNSDNNNNNVTDANISVTKTTVSP